MHTSACRDWDRCTQGSPERHCRAAVGLGNVLPRTRTFSQAALQYYQQISRFCSRPFPGQVRSSCSLSRQSFSCFSFSSERETPTVSKGASLTFPGHSLQPARGRILKLKYPGFYTIPSKSQLNGHCSDTNTSGHLFTAAHFNQAQTWL